MMPCEEYDMLVMIDPNAPQGWDWDLKHAKPGDVGYDLPVLVKDVRFTIGYEGRVEEGKWLEIPPGSTVEIPTGLRVKVPDNCWGSIKSRSSTGFKLGLDVYEGVIDSGYTGPLYALVRNPTHKAIRVEQGQRLAQLILVPRYEYNPKHGVRRVAEMPATERGANGFGHSGQ